MEPLPAVTSLSLPQALLRIGIVLLLATLLGVVFADRLLSIVFLPLGNYLHPEWDPPANFLIPIHWFVAALFAFSATGILCLLAAAVARRWNSTRAGKPNPL